MRSATVSWFLYAALLYSQTEPNQIGLLVDKGQSEIANGDYVQAEADLKGALATAKANEDAEGERQADLQLSILSEKQNQLDAAEQYLESALATWRETPATVHSIPPLLSLHAFYVRHMHWAKDVETLKKILAISSAANPDSSINGVFSIQLGEALVQTRDYPAAENAVRDALSIFNKAVPTSSDEVTQAKRLLVQILMSEGKAEEAAQLKATIPDLPKANSGSPQLVSKVEPKLPAGSKELNGSVTLSIVIDETGHPRDIHVIKSLGDTLDQLAIKAVQSWVFKPGMKNGEAIRVRANVEVNFHSL